MSFAIGGMEIGATSSCILSTVMDFSAFESSPALDVLPPITVYPVSVYVTVTVSVSPSLTLKTSGVLVAFSGFTSKIEVDRGGGGGGGRCTLTILEYFPFP